MIDALPFPKWAVYGVAAGVGLLILNRMMGGALVTSAVSSVVSAPVDAVIGAADGIFGLPDTRTTESKTKCQRALESGDDWAASFHCPASDWFGGLWDGQ